MFWHLNTCSCCQNTTGTPGFIGTSKTGDVPAYHQKYLFFVATNSDRKCAKVLLKHIGSGFVLTTRRNYRSFVTVNTSRDVTERCCLKISLGSSDGLRTRQCVTVVVYEWKHTPNMLTLMDSVTQMCQSQSNNFKQPRDLIAGRRRRRRFCFYISLLCLMHYRLYLPTIGNLAILDFCCLFIHNTEPKFDVRP